MIVIDEPLLFEACRQLQLRDQNDGDWPNHKIPDVFARIRDTYLPHLTEADNWLLVVCAFIYKNAVHHTATLGLLKTLAAQEGGLTIGVGEVVTIQTDGTPIIYAFGHTLQEAVQNCVKQRV